MDRFKLFGKPEFLHGCVLYDWPKASPKQRQNWARMKRLQLDLKNYTAPGMPFVLQIEPTSRCNLKCPACPVGIGELERPNRDMTLSEFQSLIDDMEESLLFLVLWDWGEPFMNRQLPDMIRYATERGIKTVTSTNGHFLTNEAYLEEILTSGLNTLIVAIDSLDAVNYEMYRQKGQLAKVIKGLDRLMKMKRHLNSPTKINLRTVIMRQNENEIPQLRNLARDLKIDLFTVKTMNPSCGGTSMDDSFVPVNPKYRRYKYDGSGKSRIRKDQHCQRIWYMANIFSNGDVAPCCYDYKAEMKVGNIFETPLSQIWNGPNYRKLREQIYSDKNRFDKCYHCGVNFELAARDWFVEASWFNESMGLKRHLFNLPYGRVIRDRLHRLRTRL